MKKPVKPRIRPKPFKGWDWIELSERWGIMAPKRASENWLLQKTQERIYSVSDILADIHKIKAAQEYKDCQAFLKALIKNDIGCSSPLWKGLLEVDNSLEFMRYTAMLLPCMWT